MSAQSGSRTLAGYDDGAQLCKAMEQFSFTLRSRSKEVIRRLDDLNAHLDTTGLTLGMITGPLKISYNFIFVLEKVNYDLDSLTKVGKVTIEVGDEVNQGGTLHQDGERSQEVNLEDVVRQELKIGADFASNDKWNSRNRAIGHFPI